jgi:hypothetical protein
VQEDTKPILNALESPSDGGKWDQWSSIISEFFKTELKGTPLLVVTIVGMLLSIYIGLELSKAPRKSIR